MRIRLFLCAAAALTLAACGQSSTEPRLTPSTDSKFDMTCRSGYHIATREDGSESCEADTFESRAAAPTTTLP